MNQIFFFFLFQNQFETISWQIFVICVFHAHLTEQQPTFAAFNKTELHGNNGDFEEALQVRRKLFMRVENWHLPPHKAAPYCLSTCTRVLNRAVPQLLNAACVRRCLHLGWWIHDSSQFFSQL